MVDVSSRKNSITIKVESTNKKNSITATTDTARYSVSTSSDTAKYWSELSGQYANQARLEAEKSEQYANQASEIHEDIVELKDDSISAINQAKTEGVSTITDLVNESVQEYEDIAEGIRQDNSESSELARRWATSEVIVENIDYSSKYYAQLSQESAKEAINIANSANAKSDIAIDTSNEADATSNNALNIANQSNIIANSAMEIANTATDNVEQFKESIDIVLDSANKIKEIEDAVQLAVDSAELANQASENAIEAVDNVISSLDSKADKTEIKNGTLTIQNNGTTIATFSANQDSNVTANLLIPDTAAWGKITGTLSNQTDLQNALNTKANNNSVVHKTGDESISGVKTFNNNIKGTNSWIGTKLTPYIYNTSLNPTSQFYWYKIFSPKNRDTFATYEITAHSDSNYAYFAKYTVAISSYSTNKSCNVNVYNHGLLGTANLKVAMDADGNVYVSTNCIWGTYFSINNYAGTDLFEYENMGYAPWGITSGFESIGMITDSGAMRYLTGGDVIYSEPLVYTPARKAIEDGEGRNIVNTYQQKLTAGENIIIEDNTISAKSSWDLFDTKISDHLLEGEAAKGWALQGTYVNGAIYPDFYAKCLEEYNEATDTETVNGVLVKVHSNGHKFYNIADKIGIDNFFDSVGFAWFYGIDTENERIFLPRDKYFAVKGIASVVGNGIALGFTEGTNKFGLITVNGAPPVFRSDAYGSDVGTTSAAGITMISGKTVGITTDPTKSGIEAHLETKEDKYLYICVGNTIVNESQIDASKVLSELQYKADIQNDVNSLKNYICDINFTCASKANWVITKTKVNRGSFSIGADNITIAKSGLYMFSCWAFHPTNANGVDTLTICVNGIEQYRMICDVTCDSSCVGLLNLSEGDIVQGISVLSAWGNTNHPARFILQRICDKY